MKRDMGLIRELLLKLEDLEKTSHEFATINSSEPELQVDGFQSDQIDYHVSLLYEAGLITSGTDTDLMMDGTWIFRRLTWAGHDFLDTVRDPEVWKRTKSGASKLGGLAFEGIKNMATAYAKHVAKERLGLDL
ncbi:DUF2513 domain-containing protein [Methylobacterium sp. J-078]|uniref:DUF2513 domain-containing protein n=1 Tax=Methylobacterium sp. J-078 TaxID=2836657 RepID=UPI001FBB92B6|nr:DUF2513 domain-containing protein [Methylobacterium sp. J-078]MCJ2043501.1 DUF2513 domain-containing protein [Methylobacterium sp. J-078]